MEAQTVFNHFPKLTDNQKKQIDQLPHLYSEWNEKINVISRKDIDQLMVRHVLHSLAIAKFIDFNSGSRILDIGTGGGFPGIPLAILFPETEFYLVDSIGKKIRVVNEVADAIGLKNLTAKHERAEKAKGPFDFIVTRAVARTKVLFQWTHQKIKKESAHKVENGFILLKGGDLSEEMEEFGRPYQEIALSDYFENVFFETKKIIYIPC